MGKQKPGADNMSPKQRANAERLKAVHELEAKMRQEGKGKDESDEAPEPEESQDFDADYPPAKVRKKSVAEQRAIERTRGPFRLW